MSSDLKTEPQDLQPLEHLSAIMSSEVKTEPQEDSNIMSPPKSTGDTSKEKLKSARDEGTLISTRMYFG